MSPQRRRNGPPGQGPAAAIISRRQATEIQSNGTPRGHEERAIVAPSTRHLRSGKAEYDRDVVRCPLCSHSHIHIPFEDALSYERHPACKPSATYTVQVVRVVPDVIAPVQRAVAS